MIVKIVVRPYRKTEHWEADVTMLHHGQEIRRRWRSPLASRLASERWARERAKRLLAEYGQAPALSREREEVKPTQRVATMPTFAEFAERFMDEHVLAEQLARPSVELYRKVLRKHLVPFFGGYPLDQIGATEVQRFKRERDHLERSTVNRLVDNLKTILHKAEQWGVLRAVPKIPRLKEELREKPHFTPEDAACFIELCRAHGERTYVAALLGLDAGLRHSEICGLRWHDVRFDEGKQGVIVVSNRRCRGEDGSPKHGKHRRVPLSPRLREALRALPRVARSPYVLHTRQKQPINSLDAVGRWFATACEGAGVTRGVHILRHTFATDAVRSGVNLRAVQKLLGHSSIVITERYLHATSSDLDDAVMLIARKRERRSRRRAGEAQADRRTPA